MDFPQFPFFLYIFLSFWPAVTTAQFFFVAVTTAHAWPPCCSVVVAISAQFCGSSFCATVRVTGTVTSTATATFPWEPTYKKNEDWGKKSDHSPLTPISSFCPLERPYSASCAITGGPCGAPLALGLGSVCTPKTHTGCGRSAYLASGRETIHMNSH